MTPDWRHLATPIAPSPKSLTVTSLTSTLLPASLLKRLAAQNGDLCVPNGTARKTPTTSTVTKTLPYCVTTAQCNGGIRSTLGWCGMEKNGSNPVTLTPGGSGNVLGNGRRTLLLVFFPDQSLTTMWLGQTDHYHLRMGYLKQDRTFNLMLKDACQSLHCSHTRTTRLLFLGLNLSTIYHPQPCDQLPGTRHDCTREYVLPKVILKPLFNGNIAIS